MSAHKKIAVSKATKRRLKKGFAAAVSLVFALLLIIVPGPALEGARQGLTLCGNTVIPSLFPFLVVAAFIIGSGLGDNLGRLFEPVLQKVFRISGAAAAPLILGAIGGYPVGATAVSQLCEKGSISKEESERLLCFAINSSPAFIIGAVGAGFLGKPLAGILLYCAHLLTSLTIGLILRPRRKNYIKRTRVQRKPQKPKEDTKGGLSAAFVGSVVSSAQSIITICAFVILFSSIMSLMKETGATAALSNFFGSILPTPAGDSLFYSRIITGILEVTNGCAAASGSGGMCAVLLSAGILGFCGLSVMFQIISLVKNSGISTKLFILTRFLHAAISCVYALILFSLIPQAIPTIPATQTFASTIAGVTTSIHSIPSVFAMLILIALLLLSVATV